MLDLTGMSLEELVTMRLRMAEAANRQMRRMTAEGMTKGNAMAAIADPWLKRRGRTRFSTAKRAQPVSEYAKTATGTRKLTEKEIRARQMQKEKAEIQKIWEFQHKQTYTIKGLKKQREAAREGFKKYFNLDYTDEETQEIMELDAFTWLLKTKGYEAMQSVARAINDGAVTAEEAANRINNLRKSVTDMAAFEKMTLEQLFKEMEIPFKPEYISSMPGR